MATAKKTATPKKAAPKRAAVKAAPPKRAPRKAAPKTVWEEAQDLHRRTEAQLPELAAALAARTAATLFPNAKPGPAPSAIARYIHDEGFEGREEQAARLADLIIERVTGKPSTVAAELEALGDDEEEATFAAGQVLVFTDGYDDFDRGDAAAVEKVDADGDALVYDSDGNAVDDYVGKDAPVRPATAEEARAFLADVHKSRPGRVLDLARHAGS